MREVNVGLCAGCTKGGNTKAKLMDEREVEIGDRIRVLTSAGSWQTRTVDSVTYDSYQVTGFVVSEPFESESVSVGAAIGAAQIASNVLNKGTNDVGTTLAVGDFIQIDAATAGNDGIHTVKTLTATALTVDQTVADIGSNEAISVYKAHLAYNDGAGTTEASECSGRGLCDDSSGECQCFKGYTGVDCSIQNALAV